MIDRNRENKIDGVVVVSKGSGISYEYSALNTKSYYIAKILKAYGFDVTILSGIFYDSKSNCTNAGEYNRIKYYLPSWYSGSRKIGLKTVQKLIHTVKVLFFLIQLKRKWRKIYYIFDDNSISIPFLLLLEWFGLIHLVYNIEEWPYGRKLSFKQKIIAWIFTGLPLKMCNKVIAVSSYLISKAKEYNEKSVGYCLPAISDFDKVAHLDLYDDDETVRYLYCGNVGYTNVIYAIIDAFYGVNALLPNAHIELDLVLHGDKGDIERVKEYLDSSKSSVLILSDLSEADLDLQYAKATVLLAPLRHTLQDKARFPQKIAEYVSHSKPIITTMIGDVGHYFESDISAIFINEFSASEIEKKMIYVIENLAVVKEIGKSGHAVGLKYLDYKSHTDGLGDFILS